MLHLFNELAEDVIIKMLHRLCEEAVRVLFYIALYAECKELLVFVVSAYTADTLFWIIYLGSLCTPQDRRNC